MLLALKIRIENVSSVFSKLFNKRNWNYSVNWF